MGSLFVMLGLTAQLLSVIVRAGASFAVFMTLLNVNVHWH